MRGPARRPAGPAGGGTTIPANFRMNPGAILGRRCPECGRGAVFRSPLVMNERCPVCGLLFGRGEPGYFTGAMYVSYALAVPLIALLTLLEYLVFPRWSLLRLVLLAWLLCVPLIPWVWQYSRVIWIHFDQSIDPQTEPPPRTTPSVAPGPGRDPDGTGRPTT